MSVQPFFFGPTSTKLYGVYQSPTENFRDHAIVFCYPIGNDYMRIHRAYKILANMFCKQGFHVFRFDYFATGDSSGLDGEGSLERWQEDINNAIAEIKKLSNTNHCHLFGARFGATLLCTSTFDSHDIATISLLDPVINGNQYLEKMIQMQTEVLYDKNRYIVNRTQDYQGNDLLGFSFPTNLRAQIKAIDLTQGISINSKNYCIYNTYDNELAAQWQKHLTDSKYSNLEILHNKILSECNWHNTEYIEAQLLPTAVLNEVVKKVLKYVEAQE